MKKTPAEVQQMLAEAAQKIAEIAANASFEFWSRDDFRLFINFKNLSQTEQDRIFNELEVSVLGLFMLQLDFTMENANEEYAQVLEVFQKDVLNGFLKILEDAGIEKKFIKQWQMLIDMRLKEYRKDLKIALSESASMKEIEDETLHETWARIETITIDCITHIRRGDVEDKDPLWKLVRKWMITLDATLQNITQLSSSPKAKHN